MTIKRLTRLDEFVEMDPAVFNGITKVIITDNEQIATGLCSMRVRQDHPLFGALIVLLDLTSGKAKGRLH